MYLQEASVVCPYCGAGFEITVDTSQGDSDFVEDCTVCCRPINFRVQCEPGEVVSIESERG